MMLDLSLHDGGPTHARIWVFLTRELVLVQYLIVRRLVSAIPAAG